MRNLSLNYFFLIAGLFLLNSNCDAQYTRGYIVTENDDTIPGKVRFYIYNINTSAFTINGLDLEWQHLLVKFKSETDRRYKKYYPETIQSYGFRYSSTNYIFHKFKLEHTSIFQRDEISYRFLNLIYKGKVAVYRNIVRVPYISKTLSPASYWNVYSDVYYEYYFYDSKRGLKKLEVNNEIKTVQDLLRYYEFEESFIAEIPKNYKFKDIRIILEDYERWLSAYKKKNLNV